MEGAVEITETCQLLFYSNNCILHWRVKSAIEVVSIILSTKLVVVLLLLNELFMHRARTDVKICSENRSLNKTTL